jgi:hypothetical protein
VYVEPAGEPADVDGSGARAPLAPERLQPVRAKTSTQAIAARSRAAGLPERSAQGRTVRFTLRQYIRQDEDLIAEWES